MRIQARKRARQCFAALAICADLAGAVAACLPVPAGAASSFVLSGAQAPLRGAHWFGRGWPVNAWTTDLGRYATEDFLRMKSDGFNTVVLAVPWLGFVDPDTGIVDESYFSKLDRIVAKAKSAGLMVVMRAGYGPNSAYPDFALHGRKLFARGKDYNAWLSFMAELGRRYNNDRNVTFFFISWEDFWSVTEMGSAPRRDRIAFGQQCGFGEWLSHRIDLATAARLLGEPVADWQHVPIPQRRSLAFEQFLDFFEDRFLNSFFKPASRLLHRLSAEVRVDGDLIYDGAKVVKAYDWSPSWDLPGSDWVAIYYSPYLGAPNTAQPITPDAALRNLKILLRHVRDVAGNKRVFIDQFNIHDETPGLNSDYIEESKLAEFLAKAVQPLTNDTDGYAFWVYFGYNHNAFSNPDFSLGLKFWSTIGAVRTGQDAVILSPDASLERPFRRSDFQVSIPGNAATFCLDAQAERRASVSLTDQTGHLYADLPFSVAGRRCVKTALPEQANLRLTAHGAAVTIASVELFSFTQESLLYKADHTADLLLPAVQAFNRNAWSRDALEQAARAIEDPEPPYPDGWMGRSVSGRAELPKGTHTPANVTLMIETYKPEGWPITPVLTVRAGNRTAAQPCTAGLHMIALPVGSVSSPVSYAITASLTNSPASLGKGDDVRQLSCVIGRISLQASAPGAAGGPRGATTGGATVH